MGGDFSILSSWGLGSSGSEEELTSGLRLELIPVATLSADNIISWKLRRAEIQSKGAFSFVLSIQKASN